ncbi:MAG: LysR family transcriptional regulator, partial [Acetivibrio ethanolgignens]
MEIRHHITYLQVADQQSFSKAAKALGYSQAAVTIQIKQLEAELGTRLFDRINKQITLTHQGGVFYQHAASILKSIEKAQDAVTDSPELNGKLAIGGIESICVSFLPKLVYEYHQLHPK